ncbi:MAG: hypothetical protein ACREIP_12080 [Alphaproteobacteria bacterium]
MQGKLVILTVYYSIIEARICVSMLQAYGIYAFAALELPGNAPHLMTTLGGIEVKVVDSDLEAAKALLADIEAKAELLEPHAEKSAWQIALNAVAGAASTFFFGVPPAPVPPRLPRAGRSAKSPDGENLAGGSGQGDPSRI